MARRASFVGLSAILLLAGLEAGCTRSATGIVREANTGRPIANALLQTSNSVWGFRGGQPVWDNESIATAVSDKDGRFRFDVAGGTGLNVTAPGYPPVHTSFCPRETPVLMGGPYPQLLTDRRLIIAGELIAEDNNNVHPPALARELGVRVSGSIFDQGSVLRVEGRGVRFVPGTGAIPAAPPRPYPRAAEADLGRDCGWFFITDGLRPVAVIEARHPSGMQVPGGPWRWFLMYARLPDSG
ncbi:MAG: carboxypeptidase-like regulatory domain-containing protein [Sphingomicrobium sp.]